MLIFLADTVHHSGRLNPDTVPYNVARIAAYVQSRHPNHSYVLFKDPQRLLDELRHHRPDVLALSHYFWNTRLNHRIARYARALYPDITIVTGGPSLDRNRDAYIRYSEAHPYVDFAVVDEGETAFDNIIALLTESQAMLLPELKERDVPGTFAILGPGRVYLSSPMDRVRNLDEFPSPYMNGMLDPFLAEGLRPIVETVRGCPYQCAFCEQGSEFFTKIARLSVDRVFAEIEYIRARTSTPQLILADVNFGILKRDLDIARFLKNSYEQHGWPVSIYVYNAKQPTESTLQTMETLYPMAQLSMSFQSTDEVVLENIHRSNIGYDKYSFITKWAKSRNIPVGTELIYGLPGETRDSFVRGYETLLNFQADYLASYNLRLFPGVELNSPEKRREFSIKTRFRPMDINLGEYLFERPERLLEIEEIVLSTTTLSVDDFFYTRRLALMVEILWNTGYLRPALAFLARHGFKVTEIFEDILRESRQSAASSFFEEYDSLAHAELVESADEFAYRCENEDYWDHLVHGRGVNIKLNLAFAGRLLLFDNPFDDFFYDFLARVYEPQLRPDYRAIFQDILRHCRASKVDLDHPEPREARLFFDVPAWIGATYPIDLEAFRLSTRATFVYRLDETVRRIAAATQLRLKQQGAGINSIAERIFMEVPATHRSVRKAERLTEDTTALKRFTDSENRNALEQRVSWGG
jgi:radical SAM superfamily enzyme YgiQ (UPF0313 family)